MNLIKSKRIFWVHTFNPSVMNAGIFMKIFFNFYKKNFYNNVKLFYLGKRINLFIRLIRLLFKTNTNDIIHVQYGSYSGFLCSLIPRKKILTIRGSDLIPITNGSVLEKIHSFFGVFLTKMSLINYNKIIVMSNRMLTKIPTKFHYKTCVLTDPIDQQKFVVKNKIDCRKKHFPKINLDKILVLFTSIDINNPIKRFSLAREAVEKANLMSNNKYCLVSATDIDNDSMAEVYNAVDICLLTSTHEGWPNCIKEAMSCNVPFVSTDVSDLSLIANKTKTCFISSDNPTDISNKILNIDLSIKENLRSLASFLDVNFISSQLNKLYLDI